MRIAEIMKSPVKTVGLDEPAEDAWHKMKADRLRHLVVTEGRAIVGVLSDRDLGGTEAGGSARLGKSVREVMTPDPVTVTGATTLREAANLLRGRAIHCLPVVDDHGRLVGIATTTDLLDLLGRGAERPVEQGKRWTLKHRGPRQVKPPASPKSKRATRRSGRGRA
jgi:CBS domain-containing protein